MLMKIILMAWRNLWRNSRRTLITSLAIALGLGATLFTMTWMEGMVVHLIKSMTGSSMGQAQVQATGFRETRDDRLTIDNVEEILAQAQKIPGLAGAAPRLYAQGLAAMGDRSSGVQLMGVEFGQEKLVTDWTRKLVGGEYPEKSNEVLIGQGLARKLELAAGQKLVVTVARSGTGDLEGAMVRIAGVISTGIPVLDDHSVIAPLKLARKLTGLQGKVHQVALKFKDPALTQEELEALIQPLKKPGLDVQPWQVLAPMLAGMLDLQGYWVAITFAIVFGLVAFSIVNTLTMSLVERFKEFGILRAIGTQPRDLFLMIVAEAASLGLVGVALGTFLGLAATELFRVTGIDMGQVDLAGMSIDSAIYPVLDPLGAAAVVLAFLVLIPFVAMIPAVKAARVIPVKALRSE